MIDLIFLQMIPFCYPSVVLSMAGAVNSYTALMVLPLLAFFVQHYLHPNAEIKLLMAH